MTNIDQFSLTTTPIEQFFNETELGTATGFVWTIGGRYYLITNWHVVTCREFPSRKYPQACRVIQLTPKSVRHVDATRLPARSKHGL